MARGEGGLPNVGRQRAAEAQSGASDSWARSPQAVSQARMGLCSPAAFGTPGRSAWPAVGAERRRPQHGDHTGPPRSRSRCGACNLIHPQGPSRAPPVAWAPLLLSWGGRPGPRPAPSQGKPVRGQTGPPAPGLKGQRTRVSAWDEELRG